MRLLHIARVVLHYAVRNAAPLIALVTLCLIGVALMGAACCGASTPAFATTCCDYAIDCSTSFSPFSLPSLRAESIWHDAVAALASWLRALTGA